MVHHFDKHDASLSEGGVCAVMVPDFPEMPHQTRNGKHFPRAQLQCEARLGLACSPPARRVGAPHERGAGGGSDPRFLTAGAASGGGKVLTPASTITPALRGVAPSTVIPTGRPGGLGSNGQGGQPGPSAFHVSRGCGCLATLPICTLSGAIPG